jgi:hypothetical protein
MRTKEAKCIGHFHWLQPTPEPASDLLFMPCSIDPSAVVSAEYDTQGTSDKVTLTLRLKASLTMDFLKHGKRQPWEWHIYVPRSDGGYVHLGVEATDGFLPPQHIQDAKAAEAEARKRPRKKKPTAQRPD